SSITAARAAPATATPLPYTTLFRSAPDDPRGSGTRHVGGAEDGIVVRRPEADGRRPKTAGPVTFGRSPLHLGRRARRGTSAVADKGGDAAPSSPPSSAPARLVRPARPPGVRGGAGAAGSLRRDRTIPTEAANHRPA